MTQAAVNAKVEELRAAGQSEQEIRRTLFNTKGVRVAQINKAMES